MKLKVEKIIPKTKSKNHKKRTQKREKRTREWKIKLNGVTLTNHKIWLQNRIFSKVDRRWWWWFWRSEEGDSLGGKEKGQGLVW